MKHYFDKNTTIDLNAYRRKSSDAIGLVKKNDAVMIVSILTMILKKQKVLA